MQKDWKMGFQVVVPISDRTKIHQGPMDKFPLKLSLHNDHRGRHWCAAGKNESVPLMAAVV